MPHRKTQHSVPALPFSSHQWHHYGDTKRERGWLRKGLQDAGWFGWCSDCFLFGEPAGLQLNVDFQRSMGSRVKWGKAWSLNGQECGLRSQCVLLQTLVSLLLTHVTASKWMKLWISVSSTVKWDNKSAKLITGWMRQYMWSEVSTQSVLGFMMGITPSLSVLTGGTWSECPSNRQVPHH